MRRAYLLAALLLSAAPAAALPDFVPKPSDSYDGFVALEMPRTEVPVGALWVQDYGPTGSGASADNLVTERSLSQVTISTELQLSLTAGLLNFLGLDPSLKNRLTARFGDLSVVRVKDMAALEGPSGEPRLIEAIKAGTITVTTDNDIGLRIETRAYGQNLPVSGRSENAKRRSFSIDGKEMFIAYRVATSKSIKLEAKDLKLTRVETGWRGSLGDRDFIIDVDGSPHCGAHAAAPASAAAALVQIAPATPGAPNPPLAPFSTDSIFDPGDIGLVDRATPADAPPLAQDLPGADLAKWTPLPSVDPSSYPLRVPIADGEGGLLDRANMEMRRSGKDKVKPAIDWCEQTARTVEANVLLMGDRLEPYRSPRGKGW